MPLMSGRCPLRVQAGTHFHLPPSTDWAGDTNQTRVNQPDRLHCAICSVVCSCARLLPNELLVLVQVDLHEEGHDEIQGKLLSQTLVPFVKSGALFARS